MRKSEGEIELLTLHDRFESNAFNFQILAKSFAYPPHHVYAQVIDDDAGKTLAAVSTLQKDLAGKKAAANRESAERVGKAIAEKLLAKKVENVVFDRGGYIFHGKVKALADAAREGGLKF